MHAYSLPKKILNVLEETVFHKKKAAYKAKMVIRPVGFHILRIKSQVFPMKTNIKLGLVL